MSDSTHRPDAGAATPVNSPSQAAPPWLRPALESAHTTRCGTYHSVNQDCCLVLEGRFYGVADGVGGGDFGEVASRVLLDHCANTESVDIRDPESLRSHVRNADAAVRRAINRHSPGAIGASTLVCAWLDGFRGQLAHVGDARACRLRFRSGRAVLEILTLDQTYRNLGEFPPPGGSADDPARMVGVGAVGNPPATPFSLETGDILLLCSDGLHRYANPTAIVHVAEDWHARQQPLRTLAERLETLALGQGSHDDITILLVRRNHRLGFSIAVLAGLLGILFGIGAGKIFTSQTREPIMLASPAPETRLEISPSLKPYYPDLADWLSVAVPSNTERTEPTPSPPFPGNGQATK